MNQPKNRKQDDLSGLVNIGDRHGRITLDFRYDGKRYQFSLGLDYTPKNLKIASKIALLIENDIIFNHFDGNTDKYKIGSKKENLIPLPQSQNKIFGIMTIKDCWELYKLHKKETIAISQQDKYWKCVDKMIGILENAKLLNIPDADKAVIKLRENYANSTITKAIIILRSAVNLAIDLGKYEGKNYYAAMLKLAPKEKNKEIKIYDAKEIKAIIQAFYDNKYVSNSAYYAPLIEFRFLTGCRPSEAIALTWDDIIISKGKEVITINKAYVNGHLQHRTKTGKARKIPCYPQLKALIENLPKIANEHNLIFPSEKSNTYLVSNNINRRYWRPTIKGLIADNLINESIPFYDQRHCLANFLIRLKVDLKTISEILGNSEIILSKHYLIGNDDLSDLPDLF